MNRTEFFQAAEQLITSMRRLQAAVDDQLAQAEDELIRQDRQVRPVPSPEDIAALGVQSLAIQVRAVMFAYDQVLKAVDMDPFFNLYFRLIDSPFQVQEKVCRLLERSRRS